MRDRKIGRWSELRALSTFQEQVGSRLEEARLTSGAVLALAVTLVGWSSLRTPMFVLPIQSARSLPLSSSESSVDQS